MARSLEQVQAIRPGAIPDGLVRPLADHYYGLGEPERALPLYLAAEGEAQGAEAQTIVYALARIYETLGDCRQALEYFERFLETRTRGETAREARWYAGGCAYRLAQENRALGRPAEALRLLDRVIEFDAPPALLDEAWFDRAEVLYGLGRYDEALLAYRKVLELNPSRTGRLVRQAEDRIRAIRFRP
jgi:tetratricopeptide (TPR) repeat protein